MGNLLLNKAFSAAKYFAGESMLATGLKCPSNVPQILLMTLTSQYLCMDGVLLNKVQVGKEITLDFAFIDSFASSLQIWSS